MLRVRSFVARAAVSALLSLPSVVAQAAPAPASAKQMLAEARAVAAQAKGKKGSERSAALEAGAVAFERVVETCSADPAVVAEASFEAGELWRRRGSLAEAERAYRSALQSDPGRYEARASFEVAHLLRRGKQFDAAVELYRKVAGLQPGTARAQSALLWCGRTMQAANRIDAAVAAFRSALQSAGSAGAVIDAGNWLAKAQIRTGDLDAARATLAEVDQRTATETAGDSPAATRLRLRVTEMTARRALQRAADKEAGAADDAVDLEADGESQGEEVEPPPAPPKSRRR
ncbi:MAG: hypothetical protein R3F56_08810 [Planctomycetota bacterium]